MKIEKLTDNKIRVIMNSEELGFTEVNMNSLMTKAIEKQDIFSDILNKAEKELDFHTDGCKLLIEAFSSIDDFFVFTITRYLPDTDFKRKKLIVKRKSFNQMSQHAVCCFDNFDIFCEFCKAIDSLHSINTNKLAKNIAFYLWKDNYYLILRNVNTKYENINLFYSTLSEFGKLLSFSNSFEAKLLEHGEVIIKKNAIDVGIRYLL